MKKSKSNRINKFFVVLIILMAASQGSTQVPVACFESDGRVNLEIDCELTQCEINSIDENKNVDRCQKCVDIPLSSNAPELKQAIKTDNRTLEITSFDITAITPCISEQNTNSINASQYISVIKTQSQLAILSTRLLI